MKRRAATMATLKATETNLKADHEAAETAQRAAAEVCRQRCKVAAAAHHDRMAAHHAEALMTEPKRSDGHICFSSNLVNEFFEVAGEVYRAPASAPLCDAAGTRRHGRWECSRAHFDRYRAVIVC